jgi:hypothetical protein
MNPIPSGGVVSSDAIAFLAGDANKIRCDRNPPDETLNATVGTVRAVRIDPTAGRGIVSRDAITLVARYTKLVARKSLPPDEALEARAGLDDVAPRRRGLGRRNPGRRIEDLHQPNDGDQGPTQCSDGLEQIRHAETVARGRLAIVSW